MIDLHGTRSQMLAEIGACERPSAPVDPGDPGWLAGGEVRWLVAGGSKRELFRVLEFALSVRFAAAPRAERLGDLLGPLRNALGNAQKHGNRRDRSKRIEVEVVATGRGALLAIRDEGDGFDVESAVRGLRREDLSFTDRGAGLRALDAARSRVAYEDGGRTVLIRFLPSLPPAVEATGVGRRHEALGAARALVAELEGSARGGSQLELCGIAAEEERGSEPLRVRCMLRGGPANGSGRELRIFAGRLFASEASARADFAAAAALHERVRTSELRIPRPVGSPRAGLRLVLHDFDPWLDLGEYLTQRGVGALPSVARRVGACLGALHRSGIDLPEEPWSTFLERLRSAGRRVVDRLVTVEADRARRAQELVGELVWRASSLEASPRAPVHGTFGLGCVHYGVDGRFYLDRFEGARCSHPGLDLGAFLADLARLPGAASGAGPGGAARQALLGAYLEGASPPTWLRDLPVLAASALLARSDRTLAREGAEVARDSAGLLEHLERSVLLTRAAPR